MWRRHGAASGPMQLHPKDQALFSHGRVARAAPDFVFLGIVAEILRGDEMLRVLLRHLREHSMSVEMEDINGQSSKPTA